MVASTILRGSSLFIYNGLDFGEKALLQTIVIVLFP